jgi:DNA-directed RNA polymerase subunit F
MQYRSSILALCAVACGMIFGSTAWAQGRRGAMSHPPSSQRQGRAPAAERGAQTPIEEFETMPPEEQRKALDRLPSDQRQKLQERLRSFNQLPPERQRALKDLYNRLHQLPAEKQDAVRKSLNKFSQEPPERQQAMRQELRSMASMSAGERKTHVSTPEFRRKFSKKDQDIIRDMSEVLPAQ